MSPNNELKRLVLRSFNKLKHLTIKFSTNCKSNQEYGVKEDNLLKTEMIVQDGFDIYELPIIIKKTNNLSGFLNEQKNKDFFINDLYLNYTNISKIIQLQEEMHLKSMTGKNVDKKISSIPILFPSELSLIKNMEIEETLKKFEISPLKKKTNSSLEHHIDREMNSRIALQFLKKMFDLEKKHRKNKKSQQFLHNRTLLITQLVQLLINSKDSQIIIDALLILLKDKYNPLNNIYKDILINEALVRSTTGEFNIGQLIDIINICSHFRQLKYQELIDYFWSGFIIRQEEIVVDHLVPIFKLLVYMKQSRNRIQTLLEKKLIINYDKLEVSQMTSILNLLKNDLQSSVVLKCASKWANLHLTSISRYHLLEFIEGLNDAKYINSVMQKSIEKALVYKNLKKKDHLLIAAISTYCSNVRLRSITICSRIEKYLMMYAKNFPLVSFIEIISSFGVLNYQPQNKEKFWRTFENRLDQKFSEFKVDEIINILLSCAYINKYFFKYTKQIFSSEFLTKLHLQNDRKNIEFLRNQLYILDIAMTIECEAYKGPILYCFNQTNPISVDLRIDQIINKIQPYLIKLAGDEKKFSRNVTLNKFAMTPFYTLDVLIHKQKKSKSMIEIDLVQDRNENTVVLIILPDYYCWNCTNLIGEQAMKIRLLRKIGFKVMLLDFKILCGLHNQSDKLTKYLKSTYRAAHEAII